jgi:hypothetical protein
MENANNRILDTSLAFFEIKDGILYATYKQGITVNLDGAKEVVKNRLLFTENIPYPVIVMDKGVKSISKEARDYLAKDGAVGLIAGALVLKSVYSTFLGNFFIKLTKPPFPSKMFTDINAALEWLEQFKSKVSADKQVHSR